MNLSRACIVVAILFHVFSIFGSPVLDARFAMRKTMGVMVAPNKEVFGGQIELELSRLVRANSRFEWSDQGFLTAHELLNPMPTAQLSESAGLPPWKPVFQELAQQGLQSVWIARMKSVDETYRMSLWLVAIGSENPEVMARSEVVVGSRPKLPDVLDATHRVWDATLKQIPFEATVLRRDGYRVVIDRGRPFFREGLRLSAYTLEPQPGPAAGPLQLVETGVIQITHVESDFSFGRVVTEWKPREITAENKIRPASATAYAGEKGPLFPAFDIPLLEPRHLGNEATTSAIGPFNPPIVAGPPSIAAVGIDLSGATFTSSHTVPSGTQYSSNSFFPGAEIEAEGWFTRAFFADLTYDFSVGGYTNTAGGRVNQSYQQFRIQGGYRWNMSGTELGPTLRGRLGFSSIHFGVDPTNDVTAPTAAGYQGILLGGDFIFPFTARFGMGLVGNAVLFPSLSEDNGTSGAATTSVSAWEFAVRAYYQWETSCSIESRFQFQNFSAGFSGTGTAPNTYVAMSTGGNALLLGLKCGF